MFGIFIRMTCRRALQDTGLLLQGTTFAFSMIAVVGAYQSNPVFVTVCGSLASATAVFALLTKQLSKRRSSLRQNHDLETAGCHVDTERPWTDLGGAELDSRTPSSSSPSETSSLLASPQCESTDNSSYADEESPWATSPSTAWTGTYATTSGLLPIEGVDKLSGYTRWRPRLKFLAKQNGWKTSEEHTSTGPTHLPTWTCRLRVNETWTFEGHSAQRRLAAENAAEAAVRGLVHSWVE
ncbi:hypothetical protein HDZ31DRAFT_60897 [Schizophyllum fasciatum]